MKTRLVTVALIALPFLQVKAQLSQAEQRIRQEVKKHIPEYLALLETTVNINSGSLNIAGVKKVGAAMDSAFATIGFGTEWVGLPDSLKRAGHLVATSKSQGKKSILLIGHLDTVFEPEMEKNPFRYLDDSTLTGQGVADMKSGNVIMYAACQVLSKLGLLTGFRVVAYYTGDEEETGDPQEVSRAHFIETARKCHYALGFETAQGLSTLAIGRRGFSEWAVEVKARQAHSAGVFSKSSGFGAGYELARILNAFRERLAGQQYLTFNTGIMVAGTEVKVNEAEVTASTAGKPNIIPPRAYAAGDLRFLSANQRDSARTILRQIAADSLAGTYSRIWFKDGFPSMEPKPSNMVLVEKVSSISKRLGYGVVAAGDPGSRGAGDISFVSFLPAIDGLGGNGHGAHAPGETLDVKSLPALIERAAILIYQLGTEK